MVATPARIRSLESPDRGGYEEYHPYGSTAWWAGDSALVSQKRYRYTGMERDEETGLQCHGVRYYAPWLGRWTGADPIGLGDGPNRFAYVHGNPVVYRDDTGFASGKGPEAEVLDSLDGLLAGNAQVFSEVQIAVQDPKTGDWSFGRIDRMIVKDQSVQFVEWKADSDSRHQPAQKRYLPALQAGGNIVLMTNRASTSGVPRGTLIPGHPSQGQVAHAGNVDDIAQRTIADLDLQDTDDSRQARRPSAPDLAGAEASTPWGRRRAAAGARLRSVSTLALSMAAEWAFGETVASAADNARLAKFLYESSIEGVGNISPEDVMFMEDQGFTWTIDEAAGKVQFQMTPESAFWQRVNGAARIHEDLDRALNPTWEDVHGHPQSDAI